MNTLDKESKWFHIQVDGDILVSFDLVQLYTLTIEGDLCKSADFASSMWIGNDCLNGPCFCFCKTDCQEYNDLVAYLKGLK